MIRRSLALAAAALSVGVLAACTEYVVTEPVSRPDVAMASIAAPTLPAACAHLAVADGTPSFRAYADGVQIYRWNGTSWTFVAPSAPLSADEGGRGVIGTHYAGPTWKSTSGSKVVGAVRERCTPDASAVPWLLLDAVSSQGPGVFNGVTAIQRLNTVGGLAPAYAGRDPGEEARVPYRTVYLFYR